LVHLSPRLRAIAPPEMPRNRRILHTAKAPARSRSIQRSPKNAVPNNKGRRKTGGHIDSYRVMALVAHPCARMRCASRKHGNERARRGDVDVRAGGYRFAKYNVVVPMVK
jgi:hypothetical protein